MFIQSILLILFLKLTISNGLIYKDNFQEKLNIKSLPSGQIYTYFEFLISDEYLSNDTRYFPRALSEILSEHKVEELSFSLTQGYWRTEEWNEPISSSPGGAQLIAWFKSLNEKTAVENWKGLTNRLSGLSCASLNFLDDTNSINPKFAFRPNRHSIHKENPLREFIRVGSLPKENVCTENLTPWTKLLPCGISRGLGSLLRSKQLFNTHYHSMGIQFFKHENDRVELRLTLSLVFDSQSKWRGTDSFVRRIFGPAGTFPCYPSSKTTVQLWKDNQWEEIDYKKLNMLKIMEINEGKPSDLNLTFTPMKYLGGYGQEYGEMIVEMRNHLVDSNISVLYVEVLPWYIRPYLHTMKTQLHLSNQSSSSAIPFEPGKLFDYTPGRDRTVLHKLEMDFTIPPSSTLRLSFLVEKRHLRWDEYPPDANHGFYLECSHFEVVKGNSLDTNERKYYYSRKLLVNLSTPDFSMPYNVICLTCTVVALAFGPLHNITTKKLKLTLLISRKERFKKIWSKFKHYFKKHLSENEKEQENIKYKPDTSSEENLHEIEDDPIQSISDPIEELSSSSSESSQSNLEHTKKIN